MIRKPLYCFNFNAYSAVLYKVDIILCGLPCNKLYELYAGLFFGKTGMPAKPLRMA